MERKTSTRFVSWKKLPFDVKLKYIAFGIFLLGMIALAIFFWFIGCDFCSF